MNTQFLNTKAGMVVAAGATVLVLAYFAEKKVRAVSNDVIDAIDPTDPNNIFASGVDNVGASLTGNKNFKLGAWIYDVFHPPIDLNGG